VTHRFALTRTALCFAVVATLALPSKGWSQTVVSLRGGINVANVDGDDVLVNPDSRVGLNFGGSVAFPLTDIVGVHLGAIYSQKGAKLDVEEEDAEATVALDYIEIPMLLTLTIPSNGPLGSRIYLGPAVAFEVGCELRGSEGGLDISLDCDETDIDTETFDIGAVGGAGLSWEASESFLLSLDLFYNLGLTSIAAEEGDAKNRTFSVQAGVGFPL
jgi:hypothetical protein